MNLREKIVLLIAGIELIAFSFFCKFIYLL